MSRRIARTSRAKQDLIDHFVYIGQASPQAADRFLKATEETFAFLATFPRIGRRRRSRLPQFRELRRFGIFGFPNHIVYYRPITGGIEVIRVLHGARDIDALFGTEDDAPSNPE